MVSRRQLLLGLGGVLGVGSAVPIWNSVRATSTPEETCRDSQDSFLLETKYVHAEGEFDDRDRRLAFEDALREQGVQVTFHLRRWKKRESKEAVTVRGNISVEDVREYLLEFFGTAPTEVKRKPLSRVWGFWGAKNPLEAHVLPARAKLLRDLPADVRPALPDFEAHPEVVTITPETGGLPAEELLYLLGGRGSLELSTPPDARLLSTYPDDSANLTSSDQSQPDPNAVYLTISDFGRGEYGVTTNYNQESVRFERREGRYGVSFRPDPDLYRRFLARERPPDPESVQVGIALDGERGGTRFVTPREAAALSLDTDLWGEWGRVWAPFDSRRLAIRAYLATRKPVPHILKFGSC